MCLCVSPPPNWPPALPALALRPPLLNSVGLTICVDQRVARGSDCRMFFVVSGQDFFVKLSVSVTNNVHCISCTFIASVHFVVL